MSNIPKSEARVMAEEWIYAKCVKDIPKSVSDIELGYCYAAEIKVAQGFTLLKIGATRSAKTRLQNFGSKAKSFYVSPPHSNFWQNEEILHNSFEKYRVPARPNQGSRAEFFNISMDYFIKHLPALTYETKK